ncbi:MAG: hypothetical protein JWN04_6414 [Myxococcaceae bacterium]|nr:hypothetical protein [Myxococcaceae bacterium]
MKLAKHVIAASLLASLAACHHKPDPNDAAGATTVENSSGAYATEAPGVAGAGTDATGIGSTGVPAGDIGNAPTPDTTTRNGEATDTSAPAGLTP